MSFLFVQPSNFHMKRLNCRVRLTYKCLIFQYPLLAAGAIEEVKVDPMVAKQEMFALLKAKIKAKVSTAEGSVDAVQTLPLHPDDADAPSLHL